MPFRFSLQHGFLIVTLSSGLIKSLPGLAQNPGSIATILAQNLPSASTFFISYITLQGIAGAAGNFIQCESLPAATNHLRRVADTLSCSLSTFSLRHQ